MNEVKPVIVSRGVPAPHAANDNRSNSASKAFLYGLLLSLFAWVANQGWTVLSLLLFGPFDWAANIAWKHISFCVVGALGTSIAWCSVFKLQFPDHDDEEDEEENDFNLGSYKRDVCDALQDLGELGFVVGYMISQCVGIQILNASGYVEVETAGSSSMMIVLLLVWVILSKVKDYNKAYRRAKAFESTHFVNEAYYVQMA